MVHQIIDELSSHTASSGDQTHTGCSVGISFTLRRVLMLNSLLRAANLAIMSCKTERGCSYCSGTRSYTKASNQPVMEGIYTARCDVMNFCLLFQPRIDIATGEIQHGRSHPLATSDARLVVPDEFILLAEEPGGSSPWVIG